MPSTGEKRRLSKKPSAETANASQTGKSKAKPKAKGGGKKQGGTSRAGASVASTVTPPA
jgi:hypothetical protein